MIDSPRTRGRASLGRRRDRSEIPKRNVDYHNLENPFPPVPVFSEDRVEAMHQTALRTLQELGMKVLHPEARQLFKAAGAIVDDETEMVRIDREIIEATLATAPRQILLKAGAEHRNLNLAMGKLTIQAGAGCPHATDRERGRRPGTLADFDELVSLAQDFDVLHMIGPAVEPQDVDPAFRHYAMMRSVLARSDKVPFVFARGQAQVEDAFEMLRIARNLSKEVFAATPSCYTIINTNSPRQLDIPMAEGLIDFARAGQLSVVTPFCLMGAMAPVSIAGALVLSHAEAVAAIALTQLAKAGAPVCYGAFASNVDMKSGAPAFGTPEQVKANLGAGQLARKVGLPWRSSAGCAANVNDAQAAHETQMSAWSAILAGCTILVHGAGWIEGGLTLSYEKLITDLEAMQVFAELCAPTPSDDADLAFEALVEIAPGGHFFGAAHTMERYQTAFYQPLVADWSNFGTWTERGAKDASMRATEIWNERLKTTPAPFIAEDRLSDLDAFIDQRTRDGGAPPIS